MNNVSSPVSIAPFESNKHLKGVLEVIDRVRVTDITYPPTIEDNASTEAFTDWLLSDESILLSRLVAVMDDKVIGHVSATIPHPYVENFLASSNVVSTESEHYQFTEISKLFVDPLIQRSGAGSLLLSAVRASIIDMNRVPILVVIDTSTNARNLYTKKGLNEIGSFNGSDGINHVFWDKPL